jgi:hypothetical protein
MKKWSCNRYVKGESTYEWKTKGMRKVWNMKGFIENDNWEFTTWKLYDNINLPDF